VPLSGREEDIWGYKVVSLGGGWGIVKGEGREERLWDLAVEGTISRGNQTSCCSREAQTSERYCMNELSLCGVKVQNRLVGSLYYLTFEYSATPATMMMIRQVHSISI
jgi:hypothetical protein